MSFRCQACGRQQPKYVKPHKLIIQIRLKKYPYRENEKGEIIDSGGVGEEIVKQILVCQKCFNKKKGAKE